MASDKPGGSVKRSADDQEDFTLTFGEMFQAQDELMQEAVCVLGATDDKSCTYPQGYVYRQPLYACLTCNPEVTTDLEKAAGVCLGCSYNCHDGHNLIELYTKRNFRCDCGNDKFPGVTCNLTEKQGLNEKNTYNQNFKGLYCTCAKPYPDPDDPIEDEMSQCTICEDWYHSRHLGVTVPTNYAEMICENCVKTHDFLLYYDGLTTTQVEQGDDNSIVNVTEAVDKSQENTNDNKEANVETQAEVKKQEVVEEKETNTQCEETKADDNIKVEADNSETTNKEEAQVEMEMKQESNETTSTSEVVVNKEEEKEAQDEVSSKEDVVMDEPKENSKDECTKPKIKSENVTTKFLADITWREKLCKCTNCMKMYEEQHVSYLLDLKDTVLLYEEQGKALMKEMQEGDEQAVSKTLKSMDRVALVEFLTRYNEFKQELTDFLNKFYESNEVLRVEHVKEFFSSLKSRKRQKVDIPYFCR